MAITTNVVKNHKINGVYQVADKDLKINGNNPNSQHNIIITSIDKKHKTARVKTITSLESTTIINGHRQRVFKNRKLADVRNGNILPIPKRQLRSKHYSGINHSTKIVSLNKIHYKQPNDRTIFPKRYNDLIHRK